MFFFLLCGPDLWPISDRQNTKEKRTCATNICNKVYCKLPENGRQNSRTYSADFDKNRKPATVFDKNTIFYKKKNIIFSRKVKTLGKSAQTAISVHSLFVRSTCLQDSLSKLSTNLWASKRDRVCLLTHSTCHFNKQSEIEMKILQGLFLLRRQYKQ